MTQAFPLKWPEGWPRTTKQKRQRARFDTSWSQAVNGLLDELRRLGAKYPVVSSDLELRRKDGLPYAGQKTPEDRGVAVWFALDGEQRCIPCDRWDRIQDNIQAIKKTIEAMRGIERWGTGEMLKRTFSAFEALPAPDADDHWSVILEVPGCSSKSEAYAAYLRMRSYHHPDKGGNAAMFHKVQAAWEKAQEELR